MLDVQDLRLITTLAGTGTLTRAATVLHVTQSALSHRLANVEDRLGTPLFERRGRLLHATPAGLRLAAEASTLLSELQRVIAGAQDEGKQRSAVIRIATECYTCYQWLPPVFRVIRNESPGVEINIVLDATRRPLPALLNGEIDVGIVSSAVRDRRLQLTPLFRDELIAIVARQHPWAGRTFIRAEDFATEHLLAYTASRQQNTLMRAFLIPHRVTPAGVSEIPITEALIEMVAAGFGVAALARWAAASALERGLVSALRIGPRGFYLNWHAATLRSAANVPHVRTFIRALKNRGSRGYAGNS